MGQVAIKIHGRQYPVACDDGQEAHLAGLGRNLDERAEKLASSAGSINDALLLVMVALVVADELTDAVAELKALNAADKKEADAESQTAGALKSLADRIERIAAQLEGA